MGKALVRKFLDEGQEVTLFTRGNLPVPQNVAHIKGDRTNDKDLQLLKSRSFDVIVDSSGRTSEKTQKVLEITGIPSKRFIYVSSAGVYSSSDILPITESHNLDRKSRHIGKSETENWLIKQSIPFTSFRPTYIYGPGNYNSIERWFFDRIVNSMPIPMPSDGQTITQLGHVSDLAEVMSKCIRYDASINSIYNCSGKCAVSFIGLARIASIAAGKDPEKIQFKYFDPLENDLKSRKIFPLRLTNFFTDITKIESDLDWEPSYNLLDGLIDSYNNDYLINPTVNPDFTLDSKLI